MKKFFLFLLIVFLGCLGALAITFMPARLKVPPPITLDLPEAKPPEGVELQAIESGKMFSLAAFAFRGGSFADRRVFGMGSILVRHPQGNLLFDAGFGRNVDAHFEMMPWLMRATTDYQKEEPVAKQLASVGLKLDAIKAIILTHAHWDHVSGLDDMRGVPVWVPQAELDFVNSGDVNAEVAQMIGTANYQVYEFKGGPYLGFESSYDVFGDGSVVLVPAPGHTPGSIIAFVTVTGGQRYALVGDLVWQSEGLHLPAERPWLSRLLVDEDPEKVRQLIVKMKQINRAIPDLIVVPAHDRRLWDTLPNLKGWLE